MFGFWNSWLESVHFSCEAQSVVAQRLMLFAIGGAGAAIEADRMIAEKVTAFCNAQIAAEKALSKGQSVFLAAEQAFAPVRNCVHANCVRLTSGLH